VTVFLSVDSEADPNTPAGGLVGGTWFVWNFIGPGTGLRDSNVSLTSAAIVHEIVTESATYETSIAPLLDTVASAAVLEGSFANTSGDMLVMFILSVLLIMFHTS
jgi:hypothetical protein